MEMVNGPRPVLLGSTGSLVPIRKIITRQRKNKREGCTLNRNKSVFEVEISNVGFKGDETHAALTLPAPWGEFHDALQKARIEDGHHCRVTIQRKCWKKLTFDQLGRIYDLYELNLLAKRLTELTKDEARAFDELLELEQSRERPPFPLPHLINLTYNTDYSLLIHGRHSHETLGEFLYQNKMLPEEAMRLLDTAEKDSVYRSGLLDVFGKKRVEDKNGLSTPDGYAEPAYENRREIYVPGKDETAYFDQAGAAVVLEITKGSDFGNDLSTRLALPASEEAIRDAVEAVGAASVKECTFCCVDCLIPALKEILDEEMVYEDDLTPATETAALLRQKESQWGVEEIRKYKALLEATECSELEDAVQLMDGLEQYELFPDVAQPWNYAELVLREKYPDLPAELFQTGQSAEIGRKMLEESHDALTSYGLLRNKNGEPLPCFEPGRREMTMLR